jgi:hypothetical protein
MTKTQAALAGGDDFARAQPSDADPQIGDPDGSFELEHQGQVYQLPNALKGGFLRQADYTRKTQELAAHRRSLIAAHQAVTRHAQAAQGALSDQAHLAALNQSLRTFGAIDWRTLAQQNPQRAQVLWARFQQTKALRDRYAAAVSHYGAQAAMTAGRQAAQRMAQTGAVLQRQIPGWSPELAGKLVDYARGHGVTLEEMRAADDPRVWKIIHCAYQGDCANQRDGMARTVAQAQVVRPAIVVAGAAATGGGVRDELGTKEWMKRRNDLLRKKR